MKSTYIKRKSLSELVIESSKKVMHSSDMVSISDDAIEKFITYREPHSRHWLGIFPWIDGISDSDALLDILFAFNSISFCYWGEPKWSAHFSGETMDGSKLLLMCLRDVIHRDSRALRPSSLVDLNHDNFRTILRNPSHLKFVNERHSMLRFLGEVVCDKYSGSYLDMINQTDGSAQGVLSQLVNDFPSFQDVATYGDDEVCFYKRAQLLVSDISYCLSKGGFGGLKGIATLTACADYKVPQMLRMLGVLVYNTSLANKIDSVQEIEKGSSDEIQIRAATVLAVDRIASMYRRKGQNINAMNVNDDLWIMSQSMSSRTWPYHRTLTTNY